MEIQVFPSKLSGSITVPSSKSLTHRAILAAILCDGVSTINNVLFSNDVLETLSVIKSLGVNFILKKNTIKIFGNLKKLKLFNKNVKIIVNCFQSASTLRFLIPIVSAFGIKVDFFAPSNLINRIKNCKKHFLCKISNNVVKVRYGLTPGLFYFKNCTSSQLITGLLLVLPILKKDSTIVFDNNLESTSYLNLTVDFLKKLNIKIKIIKNGFKIKGNQNYKAFNYFVEGDYSQAAFFGLVGCLNKITLKGLNLNSKQGDLKIFNILNFCGVKVNSTKKNFVIEPIQEKLKKFEIDLKNIPDLAPVLAILASMCEGISKIEKIARLAYKESNRIISIYNMIKNLGGKIKIHQNSFLIKGVKNFSGGQINSYGDHRIVMAATIASIYSTKPIVITKCESVYKSYPNFFKHFRKLGGKFSVINLG